MSHEFRKTILICGQTGYEKQDVFSLQDIIAKLEEQYTVVATNDVCIGINSMASICFPSTEDKKVYCLYDLVIMHMNDNVNVHAYALFRSLRLNKLPPIPLVIYTNDPEKVGKELDEATTAEFYRISQEDRSRIKIFRTEIEKSDMLTYIHRSLY